jgi:hypothetical protein
MTLSVNANTISIKNKFGVTKFTSDNKLVYLRAYQTGSVTLSNTTIQEAFTSLSDKDFLVLTIKINSGTGQPDLVNSIINREIPANGGVVVDFYGRPVDNTGAADVEILGVDLIGNQLTFKTVRYPNTGIITSGTTTVNLTYYARIWSYL